MGQGLRSPRSKADRRRPTEPVPIRSCSEEQPNSERGVQRLRSWRRLSGSRPWRGPGIADTRPIFGAATTSVGGADEDPTRWTYFVGPDVTDLSGRHHFGGAGGDGPKRMGPRGVPGCYGLERKAPLRWGWTRSTAAEGRTGVGLDARDLGRELRFGGVRCEGPE